MGCCRRVSSIVCDCRRMYTLPNKTQLDKLGTISGPLPSRFLTLGMQIDAGVCKSGAGFGQLALGNRFVANTLHIQQTETFAFVALVLRSTPQVHNSQQHSSEVWSIGPCITARR